MPYKKLYRNTIQVLLLSITGLFLITGFARGQKYDSSFDHYLDSINRIIGFNDVLINGYLYIPPSKKIEGHPYFGENRWNPGTIYINGHTFRNKLIKYNLQKNDIILKANFGKNNYKLIRINILPVDSFRMNGRIFVQSSIYTKNINKPVFYEKIHDGEYKFVRQYSKRFIGTYEWSSPQGKFSETKEEKFIIRDHNINKINSKRAFLRFFPRNKRKKIRKFLRDNDIDFNKANTGQLSELANYCFNKLDD